MIPTKVKSKYIIVCDDDPSILQMTTQALGLNPNYQVLGLTTAEEVLQILKTKKPLPDLLILDLWLPEMDSDELIPLIRQDPALKHIPIILISAIINLKIMSADLDVEDYLSKPFLLEELEYKVDQLLKRKEDFSDSRHF